METRGIGDSHKRGPRQLRDLELGALAEKNALLRLVGQAELLLDEMIAGRLYTGPMFQKYNLVLRAAIEEALPFMKEDFEAQLQGQSLHNDDPCAQLRGGQVLEAHQGGACVSWHGQGCAAQDVLDRER